MILNDLEKKDLENLKLHPWFKILEKIEREKRVELWEYLITLDLTKEENIKMITNYKIYAEARQDFLDNVSNHLAKDYWVDKDYDDEDDF